MHTRIYVLLMALALGPIQVGFAQSVSAPMVGTVTPSEKPASAIPPDKSTAASEKVPGKKMSPRKPAHAQRPASDLTMKFFQAVRGGNLDIAGLLLDQGADINCANCVPQAIRPIMLTSPQGAQEPSAMLTMLVSRGADVNAADGQGQTVLTQRLKMGVNLYFSNMVDAVYLLEHGANPALADEQGYTALHYFAGSPLPPPGAGGYLLANTRESNRVFGEVLRQLVARGAKVNAESRAHKTPLMFAAGSGCNPTRIAMLLKQGADPATKDSTGKAAMDYALEQAIALGTDRYCNQAVALLKNPSKENAESYLSASGPAVVPAAAGGARPAAGDANATRQAQQALNVINSAASLLKAVGR